MKLRKFYKVALIIVLIIAASIFSQDPPQGSNYGDMLYYNSSTGQWNLITVGNPGQILTLGDNPSISGSDVTPSWKNGNIMAKDADGNIYNTVTIGTQTWMVENLKTTKYNDGIAIPNVTGNTAWSNLTTGAYCLYGNDSNNKHKYGLLYNWYAVNTGKLAPAGWHVATDADWTTLENYLIANGYNYDGTTTGNKIGKSLAAQRLYSPSTNDGAVGNDLFQNNRSGFSGLPGNWRAPGGYFENPIGAGWWTSTQESGAPRAWGRFLGLNDNYLHKGSAGLDYKYGFSVRLVKDN